MDRISVVIPAFHAGPFIGRSVGSVLPQASGDTEVLIVSDDRTDYVRLLVDQGWSDPRLRCVYTGGVGTGPANARNVGLDAARGSIVVTLDADDMLEPTALDVLVPLARRHGAAYSRPRFIDHASGVELESLDRPLPSGLATLEDVLTSHIHSYAGIAFDRNRVRARWPDWDELWEDVCFFVRCFDDLDGLHHTNEPQYRYFRVPGSLCNRPDTGEAHLVSAQRLADRLANGESLGIRNPASRRTFHRYLLSRQAIEAAYVQALQQGTCRDFHEFTRMNRHLFYRIDGALESPNGPHETRSSGE